MVEEDASAIEYRTRQQWSGTTQAECPNAGDHWMIMGDGDND